VSASLISTSTQQKFSNHIACGLLVVDRIIDPISPKLP
jgi:hypothetical protein